MLSYRHGFHAGNHADVLKHSIYIQLLRHLAKKDKAFWSIDTHAGAAMYSLQSTFAQKHAEYESGIARLWQQKNLPPALADYIEQIRLHNPDGTLRTYPGSAQLALQLIRPQDRLRLFELHSTESRGLRDHFDGVRDRRVTVTAGDGFTELKVILPPPPRRGVVLIDPSYEDRNDYRRVLVALREGLERFAGGTYAVWYPQVQRHESRELPEALVRFCAVHSAEWLHAALTVKKPQDDGYGLHGSGMFIVNPPYTLPATLKQTLPTLVELLAQDESAAFKLEQRMS